MDRTAYGIRRTPYYQNAYNGYGWELADWNPFATSWNEKKAYNTLGQGFWWEYTAGRSTSSGKGCEACINGSENTEAAHMVRKYQEMLVHLGYLAQANVNGIFGDETRVAVEEFQQAFGISVDGLIGPDTQVALQAAITRSPAPTSTTTFPSGTQPSGAPQPTDDAAPPPPPEDGKVTDEPWFWAVATVGGFAVVALLVRGLR